MGGVSERPRKVLYVITHLWVGGAEATLTRLVTAEQKIADESIVVALRPGGPHADRMRAGGVTVVELNFGALFGIPAGLYRLAKLIARTKPDIVQGWMYHGDLAALIGLILGLAAVVIISSTIRLTVLSRLEDMEVLQLIGATRSYILMPFVLEGGFLGLTGGAVSILKGAPHPNTAMLWARWAVSEEGQRVYAQAGETPAHPNVEPVEKVRPAAAYMLTLDDQKEFPRYEKLWKEIFQIR